MILDNEDIIDFDYKGREDQTVIQYKLRRMLYHYVDEITDEQINKKELIKYAVRKAFDLKENDLILNKKRKIFIKILQNIKRNDLPSSNDSKANRYNGLCEEELTKLYNEYFDADSIDSFLRALSIEFFNEFFLEKQINNQTYENKVYMLVQNKIAEELSEFADKDMELRKGFAGYIFRINFLKFFTYLSSALLKHLYLKNKYITSWIKYYDGRIFVDNNKKYMAPELLTIEGTRWSPVAIYSNILTWFRSKEKIRLFLKQYDDIISSMDQFLIDGKTPVEYKSELAHKQDEKNKILDALNRNIEEQIDKKHTTKNKDEILKISNEIKKLRNEVSIYEKEIIEIEEKQNDSHKYKKLEEKIIGIEKDIKRENKTMLNNKETYLSIQSKENF